MPQREIKNRREDLIIKVKGILKTMKELEKPSNLQKRQDKKKTHKYHRSFAACFVIAVIIVAAGFAYVVNLQTRHTRIRREIGFLEQQESRLDNRIDERRIQIENLMTDRQIEEYAYGVGMEKLDQRVITNINLTTQDRVVIIQQPEQPRRFSRFSRLMGRLDA
jgi:cell division protein FtsL